MALVGEKRKANRVLARKANEERLLGRNMQRREYDIKMRHKEIKCLGMDSIVWVQ